MLKKLYDLCSSKSTAAIYSDYQDLNKFHYGTVLAVNDKEIAIHMLSTDGEDDGISVFGVDDVIRVDVGGQYAEKMKKLCLGKEIPEYDIEIKNDDILLSVLSFAEKTKQIVSIELLESGYNDVVGFAELLADGECAVKLVDEYGFKDGTAYISVADITHISLLTEEEKRIMRLWELNK